MKGINRRFLRVYANHDVLEHAGRSSYGSLPGPGAKAATLQAIAYLVEVQDVTTSMRDSRFVHIVMPASDADSIVARYGNTYLYSVLAWKIL